MNAADVSALRNRLGLGKDHFARVVGVDAMSIFRWERGTNEPKGSALQALVGIKAALDGADARRAKKMIAFLRESAQLGGLGFILKTLLDSVGRKASAAAS